MTVMNHITTDGMMEHSIAIIIVGAKLDMDIMVLDGV
jgi:hypothetical protein